MKRWTFRILICLLLGASLNVAVAWGLACFDAPLHLLPVRECVIQAGDDLGLRADNVYAVVRRSTTGFRIDAGRAGSNVAYLWTNANTRYGDVLETCPEWSRDGVLHFLSLYKRRQIVAESRGWPSQSFGGTIGLMWESSRGRIREANEALFFENVTWATNRHLLLPLRPIFPGFIINTLFYASICFTLWFGPGMIRRRIRSARGRCIKCGYDLRGSVRATMQRSSAASCDATDTQHDSPKTVRSWHDTSGGCPECGWGREGSPTIESS